MLDPYGLISPDYEAMAAAAAASLEEAAASGDLVEWLGDALTWGEPDAYGYRTVRLGMGPDVAAMVAPGDPRNANGVYVSWFDRFGTCRISDYAAEELLKTLQAVEAC